jgi:hypothetical protein
MRPYIIIAVLLSAVNSQAQRFAFGVKFNTIGHKVTRGASIGLLKTGENQFHYFTDPVTAQDKFRYLFFKTDNQQDLTTDISGSGFIPKPFIRYYGKNRYFFELTFDQFRIKAIPLMVIGDVGTEEQVKQDPIGSLVNGGIFVNGSYEAKCFSLLPSFNIFLSQKNLLKPYLILGAPVYLFKYQRSSQDILNGIPDFSLETQADRDFFFSKINLNKVVYNYQIGLGVQFYDFFLESGYSNSITSLQASGLFTSFPRVYLKVGVNIFSIKKFFQDNFKNQVLPRERDLF